MKNEFYNFDYIAFGDWGVKDFAFQTKTSNLLNLSITNDLNYIDYIINNQYSKYLKFKTIKTIKEIII